MDLLNKKWLIWSLMIIGLIALTIPFWISNVQEKSETDVLIIGDNEQRAFGVKWMLNQTKLVDNEGESYLDKKVTSDFSILADNQPELVYISSLEAGMDADQLTQFKNHLIYNGGKVIVEHSVFDLTTPNTVRYELESLLNVRWTGWKGIAYNPETIDDLPTWLYDLYENRYQEKWSPGQFGVIFVNAFNNDVTFISEQELVNLQSPLSIHLIEGGETELASEQYYSWFSVMDSVGSEDVRAQFKLNVSEQAQEKLAKHGLTNSFPAVIEHKTASYVAQMYAGEFANIEENNERLDSALQQLVNRDLTKSKELEPYWKVFQPMLKQLIALPIEGSQHNVASYIETEEFSYKTRSDKGEQFIELYQDDQWVPLTIKGINMGMGKPGYFPGEAAISEAEYFRWFKQIGQMNANTLRVYTLQSPAFYKALYEYNLTAIEPLYFFHGAWVVEEFIARHENMFEAEITEPFHEEIRHVINAVYGQAKIDYQVGHAFGDYTYNVSDYLLGWIVGIEFGGNTVYHTNVKNKGMNQFKGKYVQTKEADPFEIWLAQSMEYAVSYEIKNYKKAHPVSYTNWPTTDLMPHPFELDLNEDLDKVDSRLIETTDLFVPGEFYSFHIYPYYPDFIDEEYSEYIDKEGKPNAYAGYLHDLMQYLDRPALVTEFGIPASRGITHTGQHGRNQGGHNEESQGKQLVSLYQDIMNEGYAGGLVFTWQDEWFKRTWNTMDFDNADRRPYWSNYQTNEQYFGVLSFESGQYLSAINIDGNINDWEVLKIAPLLENSKSDGLEELYIHHDARYLYLRINYNQLDASKIDTRLYIDTLADQGNKQIEGTDISYTDGYEFMLDIKNDRQVELFVDSHYDTHYYIYGHHLKFLETAPYVMSKDNGIYHPIKLILSREYDGVTQHGVERYRQLEEVTTGKLLQGNSNPKSEDFDSIADYVVNEQDGVIEIRLPWQLLNFKDPSLLEVVQDLYLNDTGVVQGTQTDGIRLTAVQTNEQGVEMLPQSYKNVLTREQVPVYTWLTWDHPVYHERLKHSYYDLQELYTTY